MRATRVRFQGFRRLHSTTCNVDARLVAFLGPNEAGKSSVLDALDWSYSGGALASKDRYRPSKPSDDTEVVEVTYSVDEDDARALGGLLDDIEERPSAIICARPADGHTNFVTVVPEVRHRRAPFEAAQASLADVESALADDQILAENDIDKEVLLKTLAAAKAELAKPDQKWSTDESSVSAALVALDQALTARVDDESDPALLPWSSAVSKCREDLRTAAEINSSEHPRTAIRNALFAMRPAFLKFASADRDLRNEYDLEDESIRSDPPKALLNLLGVAGVTVDELWSAIQDEDTSAFRSLESRMNRNLQSRVQPSWRQSKLTLELNVNASGLVEVLVMELDSESDAPPRMVISERSDGLREFLALSCFLGARQVSRPPILLIDEVETHLHLDAQADLVSLLNSDAEIGQVLYTTHSPAALPLDLGTGLRFVSRDPKTETASVLTNSFWDQNSPGFSRLLFAMGAGAAAFSAFRRALVCEGAAEMILLPTLFRAARDGKQVEFQVAPGLSSAASIDPGLRDIAIDTAFLVDGDASGDKLADKLITEGGFLQESVFHLPQGKALEDLLDRDSYLAVVEELMTESGSSATLDRDALDPTLTIASAIDHWAKATSTKVPGHVLVAIRLAAEPGRIKLSTAGAADLRRLYDEISIRLGLEN